MTQIFMLVAIGLLGIVAQILLKVRSLRRRTENLVTNVSLNQYLQDEWDNILLSVLALVITGIIYDQATKTLNPVIADYVIKFSRLLFITVGYMGASMLASLLGKTEKLVNKEIDALGKK